LFGLGIISNIYWAIKCIPKPWFEELFEVARIIDIYCQLNAQTLIWKIVWGCKNYLFLLGNWMHFKILIWSIVQAYKNCQHVLGN
jgi:hypothetical protein